MRNIFLSSRSKSVLVEKDDIDAPSRGFTFKDKKSILAYCLSSKVILGTWLKARSDPWRKTAGEAGRRDNSEALKIEKVDAGRKDNGKA
jgi:hypothetical protein